MSVHLQASSLPALRILVVDDQATARRVLAAQLAAAGHQVLQAESGDRALTLFPGQSTTVEGLLRRADDALYTAKSRGRNCFFSVEMQMDTHERRGAGHPHRLV